MRKYGAVAFAAMVMAGVSTMVQAVSLNSMGMGQVLVYPYYTINGGNSTLIWIANSTANGKALKLRFHEGYDGRNVLDLNVYLPPYATWAAQTVDRIGNPTTQATLLTHDTTCTVSISNGVITGPGQFLEFDSSSYAGENTATGPTGNSDGGPTGLDRTREGHFDVIEMGEVSNAGHNSLSAMSFANGSPANCAQLVNAWKPGGYWAADATADLTPPTGGLYGGEAIIDVEQGTFYSLNAQAIEGFSTQVKHTAPGMKDPDLGSPSPSFDGTVTAFVPVDGHMLQLTYARPIDAISALFMTDILYDEFNVSPGMGALSDWVVTAPTKRYYVDPQYVVTTGSSAFAQPPFQRGFSQSYTIGSVTSSNGTFQFATSFPFACDTVSAVVYDHQGTTFAVGHPNPGNFDPNSDGFESSQALRPCLETSVMPLAVNLTTSGATTVSALHSYLTNVTDPTDNLGIVVDDLAGIPFTEGRLRLDLAHDGQGHLITPHQLPAAANGDVLLGLPVIGFVAENYTNANVTPGVLANYSGAYLHRGHVTCVLGSGACH